VLRLLGVILLIVGLFLVVTIIGWFIGVWFMLFGVLLLIFGGGRRVVEVHYHDDNVPHRQEKVTKPKAIEAAREQKLRPDAASDFSSAVLLYQKHKGCTAPGDAIRMLATDALRREGFLK
jgi:hypothetical protein